MLCLSQTRCIGENGAGLESQAFSMLLPGLKQYMDYPDIASLTAPRPLLLFNGVQDPLFDRQGTEDAYQVMRPVWESQQAGSHLVTRWWEVPHLFTRDMQADVLIFFDKHLKKQ
ncbi:MAG: alpha/beta hydrolase family protein [Tannerellaceae bacterium]|nr:alpha/beta hydrolase family protein [Tannerellaceae bacterium]